MPYTTSPQECPTQALSGPVLNQWRWDFTSDRSNVIITFDPGDKCSLEFIKPTDVRNLGFDIVVNDETYQNYLVAILSLDEGKGIEDLKAYNMQHDRKNIMPPPWSTIEGIEIVQPMSRTLHFVQAVSSPVYFVCLVQGPDAQRIIEEFDGIDISGY